MWQKTLGPLHFRVEHRQDAEDRGPSLRISDASERAVLEFDCLYRNPCYRIDPKGLDEHKRLPPLVDNVAWALAEVERSLVETLARIDPGRDFSGSWSASDLTALLSEAQAAMRNPPPQLEELELDALARRQGEKWNTYPQEVLPAWVAEMDFALAEPIRLVLQRAADLGDAGYPLAPRSTGLPEAFARRMEERFAWSVETQRTEILSDVVQGIYIALLAYAQDRPGVVVQTPIYTPFLHAVKETGRRLVENPLVGDDSSRASSGEPRLHFDLEGLRRQLDSQTGILLLCNPHNPSGRVYRRQELEALAEIVLEWDLIVVSDEIHGDLVYDGGQHIPFASLGPELAARTVTLTSATKAFNIPGLRCCVAHLGSPELHKRFRQAVPPHARGGLGLLGIEATIAAWQHAQPWLDAVVAHLDKNRGLLGELLAKEIPEVRFYRPEASYLAWLDCSALELKPTAATHFLGHGNVALSDGPQFGSAYKGFARINFATSSALLRQIVARMKSALETR